MLDLGVGGLIASVSIRMLRKSGVEWKALATMVRILVMFSGVGAMFVIGGRVGVLVYTGVEIVVGSVVVGVDVLGIMCVGWVSDMMADGGMVRMEGGCCVV